MQSEHIGELAKALVEFQSELSPAVKSSQNPFFKSYYADLGSIWDAIRPLLKKNGLAVIQSGVSEPDGHEGLKTTLMHTSGQWISGTWLLKNAKPNDPQAQGSAITYLRRYSLAAILGVVADDDDGESATERKAKAETLKTTLAAKPKEPVTNSVVAQEFPSDWFPEEEPALNPIASELIPDKIKGIGGKKYGDVTKPDLVKSYRALLKFFEEKGLTARGDFAKFLARVEEYCADHLKR